MRHLLSLSKIFSFVAIYLLLNSVVFGDTILVSDYGAIGDGITDDADAIQDAFDALNTAPDNSTLHFGSNKTYLISYGILMGYASKFTVEGNNSTLKMQGTAPKAYGYWNLYFSGCDDFNVNSLHYDGNRIQRGIQEVFCHNLIIKACTNFDFYDVDSINAVCDGIYISAHDKTDTTTYSRYGTIRNFELNNNARQGLSIINGWDITIKDGRSDYTNGLAPESGIDIEPNSGSAEPGNKNITIDTVSFYKNKGYAILVSGIGKPININIKTCWFSRNDNGAVLMGGKDGSLIDSWFVATRAIRAAVDIPYSSQNWNSGNVISNNEFSNNSYETLGFYVHSGAGDNNTFKDNTFINWLGDQWGNMMVIYNSTTILNNNVDENDNPVQYYMP
jgi:hypothetical protein